MKYKKEITVAKIASVVHIEKNALKVNDLKTVR